MFAVIAMMSVTDSAMFYVMRDLVGAMFAGSYIVIVLYALRKIYRSSSLWND